MERARKVRFREEAIKRISVIALFLEKQGYPDTAEAFTNKLYGFGKSLGMFPAKFPLCRFPKFVSFNFRCAIFKEDYVFIYEVEEKAVVIQDIVHTKTLQ